MVRQGGRKKGLEAADLANFHFSSSPPARQPQQQPFGRRRQAGTQEYRRSKEDRASARKKPSSTMFYLHSSPDHAFVISRIPLKLQSYAYSGPDSPVSWSSVKIVKYLSAAEHTENCPICLDSYTCARITKCGHIFCFPCVIHHAHAYALNHPYSPAPKCPCCAIPLHLEDLRPVQISSVVPLAVNQQVRFIKLHRHKSCPCPYLPVTLACRRSSPHAAPCQADPDALYSRFSYVDPTLYQNYLASNVKELQEASAHDDMEQLCIGLALERVNKEMEQALMELGEETDIMKRFASQASGMCQRHPEHLLAKNYRPITQKQEASTGGLEKEFDCMEMDAEKRRIRGDSVVSEYSAISRGESVSCHSESVAEEDRSAKSRRVNDFPSTMYMDAEETLFYQTEDGKLCFLSGFNMNCLKSDFTMSPPCETEIPHELSPFNLRKLRPLPDIVEGKIVEIERIHLTPEQRQRYRFLSHLPFYSDVYFVEINLGRILSSETKKIFRKEFHKRKQAREMKGMAEKREDERARKLEEQRINELKTRYQRIDPSDEFFRPVRVDPVVLSGEEFGPSIVATQLPVESNINTDPGLSFSQICRNGGAFPLLGTSASEEAFPCLGSSPPTRRAPPPTWGRPAVDSEKLESAAPAAPDTSLPGSSRKKSKSKKIVLFSTSSHRGNVY